MMAASFAVERDLRRLPWAQLPVRRLAIYVFGGLYIGLLLVSMRLFVQVPFAYLGYVPRHFDAPELAGATILSIVLLALTPQRWTQPSHVSYGFMIATVALPIVWVPLLYGPLSHANLRILYVAVGGAFVLMRVCLAGNRTPLRLITVPPRLFWAGVTIVSILGLGYLVVVTGLRPSLLMFSDAYAQRDEYSSSIPRGGVYVVGGLVNGVFTAILALGMERRSNFPRLLGLGSILLVYSITGFKSFALGVVLSIGLYVLLKLLGGRGYLWLMLFVVTIGLSMVVEYVTSGVGIVSLLVRRALSTTGLNTAYYIDFFTGQPKYGLRASVLSFLGPSPYSVGPPQLIGLHYYGDVAVSANANLVADGYANFGLIACFGAGVLVGLFLRFYDRVSSGLTLAASSSAVVLILVAFANSAPLTVLATHGGLVLLLVIAAAPRQGHDVPMSNPAELDSSPQRPRPTLVRGVR